MKLIFKIGFPVKDGAGVPAGSTASKVKNGNWSVIGPDRRKVCEIDDEEMQEYRSQGTVLQIVKAEK